MAARRPKDDGQAVSSSRVVAALAVIAALAAPAAARAATLDVQGDAADAGPPANPRPTPLELDFEARGGPLGTITLELPSQFRMAGTPELATCAADQVAAGSCPRAARVAGGELTLVVPDRLSGDDDEEGLGYTSTEELDLAGYALPGGGEVDFLATGDSPAQVRTVIPATVSGSTLSLALPPAITGLAGAQLSALVLDLGVSDTPWLTTAGCTRSWAFPAPAAGAGAPASASAQARCPEAAPTSIDSPDISGRRKPRPTRGGFGMFGKPQGGVAVRAGHGGRTSGGGREGQ